jgi:hypothetical protein
MNDIKITQWPVIIVANYRTGSSALVRILGRKYNLEVFSEPHLDSEQLANLKKYIENGKSNYIVKFMPDYLETVPVYNHIYNSNCYKIKLTRNDKIAQITSLYIAKMTDIWNNAADMTSLHPEKYIVNIDNNIVDLSIKQICTNEKLLDTAQVNFAQHLTYEEISFADARMKKLTAPVNYQKLYSYIEKYYNRSIK